MNTALRAKLTAGYSGIIFDEGPHTYTVNDRKLTPVSNVIETFIDEFDEDLWAGRTAIKEGKTKEEILLLWKRINEASLELGTDVHNFGEEYADHLYYGTYPPPVCYPHEVQKLAIMKFYAELDHKYYPVGLELRMFDEQLGIAGTTDILLHNRETNKFVIADWKTNKDIFKNFAYKVMKPPFQYTLDMPYNHYQIQLSLYQILLESRGWEIEERWIIWLPHSGGYELHKAFDFSGMLRKHLDN